MLSNGVSETKASGKKNTGRFTYTNCADQLATFTYRIKLNLTYLCDGRKNYYTGTKRPRQTDKSHIHVHNEDETSQSSEKVAKESNAGRGKEASNSVSSSSTKPPKKKVKTIKKK